MALVRPGRGIGLVLVVVLLAAWGQTQPAASTPQELTVATKEFAFTPAALTVTAGQPVTIRLQNSGSVEYDFSIREIEIRGTPMSDIPGGLVLQGVERAIVFNRLRAMLGLRWELPRLLHGVNIPPGSRCLEIGTGMGWGTLGLLQRYPSIEAVATDYDRVVLPMARSYIQSDAPGAHVAFCQANAKAFPFPDHTFDIVLALYVLHHVAGYRAALEDIGRVTRPGGRFLFIDVVRAGLIPRLRRIVPPDGLPSQTELTHLLEATGFWVERWNGFPGLARVTARKR